MKTISIFLAAIFLLLVASRVPATTFYVNVSNTVPLAPYTNWPTAATNIQDAIDASTDGDLILVTNGLYATGGRVVYGSLTNRVVINKAVTVKSVNGPDVTIIQGNKPIGNNAVRCAYLTNNAILIGFALTNGATRNTGGFNEQGGAGVWCESTNSYVMNCRLVTNNAATVGGSAAACATRSLAIVT